MITQQRKRAQIMNSQSSSWRRQLPHHMDTGQRFVVYYRDGMGTKRILGYPDTEEARDRLIQKIKAHAIFHSPTWVDRRKAGQ